ncbi:uvb-resistance protein uvr8, putative [Pediculus humanus corporis]|uniref:Uvb-resistance protein uvr8, putative n=1 Tax=Pediculus humanus subsp. corporis TaxID=121224 RepID=E0VJW0_PEDHC|nr:uvb-resistance protein uvr8, putative [Pediculus humanus corporis]EEB13666.1 uvb-resistance protein uvr8, putative [Pediculus humanus corporis]
MSTLHFVGFNGYNQFPSSSSGSVRDSSKIINNWTCVQFEKINNVQCTHRFIIIETKENFVIHGLSSLDSKNEVVIKKPVIVDSFSSSDEILLTSSNLNLWKFTYKNSKWRKLNLSFMNEFNEKIWKEIDNKVSIISHRIDLNSFILLLSNGSVWTLSNDDKLQIIYSNISEKAINVVSGLEHSLILTESGCVLSFGNGSRGQLGNGTLNSIDQPSQIPALEGLKVINIAAGNWHSFAITDSGDLCGWGWNNYGQLATFEDDEEITLAAEPIFVEIITEEENIKVVDVSCGSRHTIAKIDNGDLYGTGWNVYRQLGINSDLEKTTKFTKVSLINNQKRKLICGPWYSILYENLNHELL